MQFDKNKLHYCALGEVPKEQWLRLLNNKDVRQHLMPHPLFTEDNLNEWLRYKDNIDQLDGYRVSAIIYKNALAGWCGIQPDDSLDGDSKPELAVILDKSHWGIGKFVYADLLSWCREFGHVQVLIHFFNSRKIYRFLQRKALTVSASQINGYPFMTYLLSVGDS